MLAIALPVTPVILFLGILAFPVVFMLFAMILYYAFPSDAQKKTQGDQKNVHCCRCGALIEAGQQVCAKCTRHS
jgi:hypothetical protein